MERSSGSCPPTSPITTKGKEHAFDDDEIDDEGLDQEIKDLIGESDNDDEDALLETNYGSAEYWNDRYRAYSPFDWLLEYDGFKDAGLCGFLRPEDKILMVGCGSSQLSADLYDEGFKHIMNIDTSDVVIERMRNRNLLRDEMTYMAADASKMPFDDETFDVALDKSTMDCIFCCENSRETISEMVHEIWRTLIPGGLYIFISLHDAEKVLPYMLENAAGDPFEWANFDHFSVPNPRWEPDSDKSKTHEVFIAIKPAAPSQALVESRGTVAAGGAHSDDDDGGDHVDQAVKAKDEEK